MPRIKTDQLKEGMTVVTDVKNMDDMLLIPAGAKLVARQIAILQAWGVLEIEVKTAGEAENTDVIAKLPPEKLEKLTAETKAAFWKLDEAHPASAEILRLVMRRRVKRGMI
jgi:hypothetical protein